MCIYIDTNACIHPCLLVATQGNLKAAAAWWDKAVALVSYDKAFPAELAASSREVKKACWLNLAQVRARACSCVHACT